MNPVRERKSIALFRSFRPEHLLRVMMAVLLSCTAIVLAGAVPLRAQGTVPGQDAGAQKLHGYVPAPPQPTALVGRSHRALARFRPSGRPPAPDFTLEANDGRTYSLKGLRGKVVLLFFWATWCPYCRRAMPHMADLASEYANAPFTMIGICREKDADAWRRYIRKHDMPWPQYLDRDRTITHLFRARGVPNFVLIDKSGGIVLHIPGWADAVPDMLEKKIDQVLHEPDQQAALPRLMFARAPAPGEGWPGTALLVPEEPRPEPAANRRGE